MTFQDVKVFAGEEFLPAADVAYNNLTWDIVSEENEEEENEVVQKTEEGIKEENEGKNEGLSGVVEKDNEIGTIESWGPHFRVSFEMIIKSFVGAKWTNILSFKGNGATSHCCQLGDRAPAIFLQNKEKYLLFSHSVNGNGNYAYTYRGLQLNKWYKITVEQIKEIRDGKVRVFAFYF